MDNFNEDVNKSLYWNSTDLSEEQKILKNLWKLTEEEYQKFLEELSKEEQLAKNEPFPSPQIFSPSTNGPLNTNTTEHQNTK